ncbi:MAG: Lrp/AsnC ligand binding domain-containing protein [Candidatus Undinarchaeales archaeon]|jgi:DNA-binding Lrp family transcriptional regulator|nr:Lrp/AsnC ligand binding domain-containing protein [Candidatus Undinarchaeales archaeon]
MITAFVLATTKSGREKEALISLQELPEIKEAHTVYGDYDIVLQTETKSIDDLNNFLLKKLRSIQSISATTTMISL